MKLCRILISLIGLGLAMPFNLSGQESIKPTKVLTAPTIDGVLAEQLWTRNKVSEKFYSWMPEFGNPLPFDTEVFLVYTDEDMYFGFKCYDPEPEKLKATVSARDQIRMEDWICINLDPFNDQQSLYAFYCNPFGIQMDERASSNGADLGADFVYYSKGSITDQGYEVEIRIPFKSLRYSRKETVEMGMIFERRIHRLSMQGTYPALDPKQGMNFFTQMAPYDFKDIKHYTLIELLPAFTYSRQSEHQSGELALTQNRPDVSLTGKLGITSQLILDLTYNPDFSQVEADAGQIEENQRYSLYYPEKRPFFQEGNESFDLAAVNKFGSLQSVVHTRQIVNPLLGLKLTGKISAKSRIALLYALDEQSQFADSAQPYSNFIIGRYQYALKNDSYVGLVMTSRSDPTNQSNFLTGVDGRFRLASAAALEYHLLGSSSVAEIGVDNGLAATLAYIQGNEKNDVRAEIQRIGEGFQTNTGFLRRNGTNRLSLTYKPHFYLKDKFIKRFSPMAFGIVTQDIPSQLFEYDLGLGLEVNGDRSLLMTCFVNPSTEVFMGTRFPTHSVHLMGSSQIFPQVVTSVEYRYGKLIRYLQNPYSGSGHSGRVTAIYQPVNNFNTEISCSYQDFYNPAEMLKEFKYLIIRSKNTYQVNKYLFFRIIGEYNSYRKDLTTDFLVSFTYIPGTVIHLGYGSLYEQQEWNGNTYQPGSELLEKRRGIFFKASYLYRN